MTRLLLIDDADDVRETLAYLLTREGYDVVSAGDGKKGLELFASQPPDIVVLDLMIPEVSGIEVCRRIRMNSDVPIIMLTAMVGEANVVVGLESGADDYITKPFSVPELLARLRSLLRRRPHADAAGATLNVGPITMDVDRHSVTMNGKQVELPLREFEVLELLLRNAGRVLTRSRIIEQIWGSDYFGDTKTLDVHIRRLRAKLEPDPAHPRYLVTVRGLGYRFEDVRPPE